jgi:hypothetical protein
MPVQPVEVLYQKVSVIATGGLENARRDEMDVLSWIKTQYLQQPHGISHQ